MLGQGPCTSCKTLVQTPAPRLGALVVRAELLGRPSRGGWVKRKAARWPECPSVGPGPAPRLQRRRGGSGPKPQPYH